MAASPITSGEVRIFSRPGATDAPGRAASRAKSLRPPPAVSGSGLADSSTGSCSPRRPRANPRLQRRVHRRDAGLRPCVVRSDSSQSVLLEHRLIAPCRAPAAPCSSCGRPPPAGGATLRAVVCRPTSIAWTVPVFLGPNQKHPAVADGDLVALAKAARRHLVAVDHHEFRVGRGLDLELVSTSSECARAPAG